MVEINVAGYGYLRLAPKAPFARRDSHRSITHIYTAFANISEWIWCVIQTTYSYLKQFLRHKTRVNNTRNVDRFCDSIICTLGPNYVTIRVGNQQLFHQTILTKGFRSQEGGFKITKWLPGHNRGAWIGEKLSKSSKLMHFMFWQRGCDSCYIGNQPLYF